jgi:aspartate/methionine/tyrosine aminotransferase
VASTYQQWEVDIDPDRVLLTASTSEAYSCLFKLLADPQQTVLVPTPSYPLIEQLARLDGVGASSYPLDPGAGWRLDAGAVLEAPPETRAVVVVHPNNPTGSYLHPDDADFLARVCAERRWALVADEVFLPFPLRAAPGSNRTLAGRRECLTFALGGLSKSVGLPQMKLAWTVVSGPEELVEEALLRLEYVADAYLSVSGPTAAAAPWLLEHGHAVRNSISTRCRRNLETLEAVTLRAPAVTVVPPGGGWSAVVRVPVVEDEESLALRLLEERGVAVHPGYLFDFPSEGYLVLSLLPPEEVFTEGASRLVDEVERSIG